MQPKSNIPVALTIAGSDSGGGAGIQADLKTFEALQCFGTSVITCITAQNPDIVMGVEPVDPEMVMLQIRAVIEGFPVAAVKTGMLYSGAIIKAVAKAVEEHGIMGLVIDPVMVATSGGRLLQEDAVKILYDELIPRARVITPNLPEAEVLCGYPIEGLAGMKSAAAEISGEFGVACVLKGGHVESDEVHDVLCDAGEIRVFSSPRLNVLETHGTGCTFSAALTAFLARGESLPTAVKRAKEFVALALERCLSAGVHHPLGFAPAGRG